MQKKDDDVGNKTANKRERQRKKESERERLKSIPQKRTKFWLLRMSEKQILSTTSD